jgi:hypothetical protein
LDIDFDRLGIFTTRRLKTTTTKNTKGSEPLHRFASAWFEKNRPETSWQVTPRPGASVIADVLGLPKPKHSAAPHPAC